MYLSQEAIALFYQKQLAYAQKLGEPLPEPRWDAEKKKLIEENRDDEFYLLVNMKSNKITWHHNMNKWLGYDTQPEIEESFFDVLVHPFILNYYNAFAIGMFDLVSQKKDKLSYMNFRYKITIPLRKADSEYICVQQICYPCHFDAHGNIVTYFIRYLDNGLYLGQPLQPSIMLDNKTQNDYVMLLHRLTANHITITDEKLMFTRDEMKVLNEAYQVRFDDKRNELLQKKLHLSIKHYNASIKAKTKTMFFKDLALIPKHNRVSNFDTCLPKLNDVYQISEFLYYSHLAQVIESKLRHG